jgi:hypothetical protein
MIQPVIAEKSAYTFSDYFGSLAANFGGDS